ncbi:MAG TPA: response regulator [Roseiflexaceae bacterium]|nr:response regulator [Roseiflexaceae bacterium]
MQSAGDILVVDDDQPILDLIAEVLKDEGYTVRTALTPDCARAAITERRPDLLLLDLTLPGVTGDVVAREFKNDSLADVPIVLMTADTRAAKELSMEDIDYCLVKPFDLDELVECVAKYIPTG